MGRNVIVMAECVNLRDPRTGFATHASGRPKALRRRIPDSNASVMLFRTGCALASLLGCGLPLSAQRAPAASPLVLESAQTTIVVVDRVAAPVVRDDGAVARLASGCRQAAPLSAGDSARIARAPALGTDVFDAPEGWPLVFIAAPRPTRELDCGLPGAQRVVAAARGLVLSGDSVPAARAAPTRVALVRGGALLSGQTPLQGSRMLVSPSGWHELGEESVGVAVDIAALAPTSIGLPPDLVIAVWTAGSPAPTLHAVPVELLHRLWDRATWDRLDAALDRSPEPDVLDVALPAPRDHALAEAHALHASGEYGPAVRAALLRLRDDEAATLRPADQVTARLRLGLTAFAYGDTTSARVHFELARVVEPCVRFGDAVPPAARQVLDGLLRTERACARSPLPLTLLRGVVLPGFGHRRSERGPLVGILTLGVLGFLASDAARLDRDATRHYQEYLGLVPNAGNHTSGAAQASVAYERAEASRLRSIRLGQATALVWGLAVVDAVLGERRFRARLAVVENYGSPNPRGLARARWIAPHRTAHGVGLALGVF